VTGPDQSGSERRATETPVSRNVDWPSATTTLVATIGDPIRHSLSPLLHQVAFAAMGIDWVSVAFEVPAGAAARALTGMRALGIAGLSVTMPHKADVAGAVDELTPVARSLGAVNCVLREGDLLIGDSTDGEGFLTALERATGFTATGKRCLVLGAGGAARAVVLALGEVGAEEVVVVNRTKEKAEVAAQLAGAVGRTGSAADAVDADLVVQATPVGMVGSGEVGSGEVGSGEDALIMDPELIQPGQIVADLVYHPEETRFLEEARRRGATTVNGLGMLVHQAALAVERWTGRPAPVEAMWAAASSRARRG